MGKDLAEAFPAARAVFAQADDVLGAPLSRLCFDGPAESLTPTQWAQPALLTHGAAIWAVVREALAGHVHGAAGHSLGEFSAYHVAGALSLGDAVRLVHRRGELMADAGGRVPGAMAAILGALQRPIEDVCRDAAAQGVVVPANYNHAEQIVISGEVAAVEAASELAKTAGARRVMRLQVSGAFHSPLMAPAADGLREALDAATWAEPTLPVWSNVTAEAVTDARTARRLLLDQLTSPVRWTDVVRHVAERHPGTTFVEMGPGAVLTHLVRRLAPDCTAITCGTAAEVEALLAK